MSTSCECEPEVARAARHGRFTPELRAHALGCDACAETLALTAELTRWADEEPLPPMASAGFLFWKAALRARRDEAATLRRWHAWLGGAGLLAPGAFIVAALAQFAPGSASTALAAGGAGLGALVLVASGALWAWSALDR